MRIAIVLVALIFASSAATVSMYAQGRGNGQAKKTTVNAPKAKSTTQSPKQTAKATTKTTTKAETRAVKAETRAAKNTAKADTQVVTTEPTATKTERKVAKLNPEQEAKLLARLPAGTNIQDASAGFRNWGQFNAAVNASFNHNIPFAELKARMTGIPVGSTERTMTPMSLGQAIQSFKGTTTTAPSRVGS